MNELPDLTFSFKHDSGKVWTITFHRQPDCKPRVVSTFRLEDATDDEVRQYGEWKRQILATVMSSLTYGEVLGSAAHGQHVLRKRK